MLWWLGREPAREVICVEQVGSRNEESLNPLSEPMTLLAPRICYYGSGECL